MSGSYAPQQYVLLPSVARTATVTGADQKNLGHLGVDIVLDVTAYTADASVTPKIEGKDANGVYYTILTGAAVAATGTTVLTVYPSVAASANVAVSRALPAVWRLVLTAADTKSVTYSVGVNLLP